MSKTPKELLQQARWVQLDVLGSKFEPNQAVGLIMMNKPERHKHEIRYLNNYIGQNFLGKAEAAEFRNEWVYVRIGDAAQLQREVKDLKKFELLSELFEKSTWGTPLPSGEQMAHFKHHKDALICSEAFRWMTYTIHSDGVLNDYRLSSVGSPA